MKTIRIFSLLLCGALLALAACEGGFVEPSGKLIVENRSSSTITSVQTKTGSSAWLERWTGSAATEKKITLQIDPGTYEVRIESESSEKKPSDSLTITVIENAEKLIIFNGTDLQLAP